MLNYIDISGELKNSYTNRDTSNCSSVNCSFWKFQVSAWVLRNSATALVTVDLTGDGSATKRANSVTWSGNQLKEDTIFHKSCSIELKNHINAGKTKPINQNLLKIDM